MFHHWLLTASAIHDHIGKWWSIYGSETDGNSTHVPPRHSEACCEAIEDSQNMVHDAASAYWRDRVYRHTYIHVRQTQGWDLLRRVANIRIDAAARGCSRGGCGLKDTYQGNDGDPTAGKSKVRESAPTEPGQATGPPGRLRRDPAGWGVQGGPQGCGPKPGRALAPCLCCWGTGGEAKRGLSTGGHLAA